jgi:hypothetical protein
VKLGTDRIEKKTLEKDGWQEERVEKRRTPWPRISTIMCKVFGLVRSPSSALKSWFDLNMRHDHKGQHQ